MTRPDMTPEEESKWTISARLAHDYFQLCVANRVPDPVKRDALWDKFVRYLKRDKHERLDGAFEKFQNGGDVERAEVMDAWIRGLRK